MQSRLAISQIMVTTVKGCFPFTWEVKYARDFIAHFVIRWRGSSTTTCKGIRRTNYRKTTSLHLPWYYHPYHNSNASGNHDTYVRWPYLHRPMDTLVKQMHNSKHYAFDVDGVHFICCSIFPNKDILPWLHVKNHSFFHFLHLSGSIRISQEFANCDFFSL